MTDLTRSGILLPTNPTAMKTVTIFSTPTCGFCKALKQFLDENQVQYTDLDVTTDETALKEMQEVSDGGLSVPVIVFNKGEADQEVQIGYEVDKVKASLNL